MFSVLVVENNALFRRSLREILGMYLPAISIEEAADSREALAKINGQAPDVILMDIHLPGKNGLELTREIKATHPQIIITVLTAYDLPEYQETALKHGADHFLIKGSFTGSEVAELIKSILFKKES